MKITPNTSDEKTTINRNRVTDFRNVLTTFLKACNKISCFQIENKRFRGETKTAKFDAY